MPARLTSDEYINGVISRNRIILSRAITLIESELDSDRDLANQVLAGVLNKTGNSVRIGITGVPGVGKSTFIESFGSLIVSKGHKVAVLTIDPSSKKTRGSILGDKTRMESLSTSPDVYIRPSPSGSTLGGVARKTRESMLLCEAAGYDVILVETVGVGQSETTVKDMTDFFLLLMLAGAGDELQGIKKGVMEMADMIAVNKADGNNASNAKRAVAEYKNAIHLFRPSYDFWNTEVVSCSALENIGLDHIWDHIEEFLKKSREHNFFEENRQQQDLAWFDGLILDYLKYEIERNKELSTHIEGFKQQILNKKMVPGIAAEKIVQFLLNKNN